MLRFTDDVVAGPEVGDDVFDRARSVLGERGVVTVIVLIGHYMSVARVLGVLEIPLDDQPDSWSGAH